MLRNIFHITQIWLIVFGPIHVLLPMWAQAAIIDEGIEDIYLSLEDALKIALPDALTIETKTFAITPEQRKRIEQRTRRPVLALQMTVYIGKRGEDITGYAMITEEIGLYKPITSMVSVLPNGKIRNVSVMVYRESRGSEVKRKRFLRQYWGKSMADPIRLNRDVINVTGATLSVRSMNAQIRKALAIVNELFI